MADKLLDLMQYGEVSLKELEAALKELPLPQKIKCVAIYKRYLLIRKDLEHIKTQSRVLDKKYLKFDEPILIKTSEMVKGKRPIQITDIAQPEKYLTPEEITKIPEHLAPRKISRFWSKTLQNSGMLKKHITGDDIPLLDFIEDVHVVDEQGTDNFTIVFQFSQNEIISNPKLQKKYTLKDDQPIKCQSTVINWKGKNLCMKEVKKKQKNKKTGQHRIVTKTVEAKSFFNFFRNIDGIDPNKNPMELTEDEMNIRQKMQNDFELGGQIVDEVIPYSLEYFLGIEHEQDQDDEEDQNDEDDDSDNDDKDKKSKSKQKSKEKSKDKKKKENKATAQKPQCKQQ